MSRQPSANAIDERAAEWVVRMDGASLSASEQAEFEAWMGKDARHAGAFYRAKAAWRLAGRARALGASGPAAAPRPLWARRAVLGGLAAAGIGGLALFLRDSDTDLHTELGEVRNVPLADGSSVSLNTTSRVRIALEKQRRVVMLSEGEAWFQVAHDPARPFVVEAGDTRVRAVGTAFSVRRDGAELEVLVSEGVVEVWRVTSEDAPVRLEAGAHARLTAASSAVERVSVTRIDERLAWRDGMIALEGRTLSEAAVEFNRYNRRKVEVADDALAQERLVGWFRATDVDSFVTAATIALDARAERAGDRIILHREGGER
jgi:transmembrane sensor